MSNNYLRDSVREQINKLVYAGIGLSILGGVVMALAWPGTEPGTALDPGPVDTGNAVVAIAGAFIAWAGSAFLLVGLVAWGVRLGNEASRESN